MKITVNRIQSRELAKGNKSIGKLPSGNKTKESDKFQNAKWIVHSLLKKDNIQYDNIQYERNQQVP